MNPLQYVHYWVSFSALGLALVAALMLLAGILHPLHSRRGDSLVKIGVWTLLSTVAVYLIYAATAVTTVVVMRS